MASRRTQRQEAEVIRIIVRNDDAGMAANVGGPVHSTFKSFDVSLPELEVHLREPTREKWTYTERRVIGIELLPNTTESTHD